MILTVGTLFLVTMADAAPAAQTIWINGLGEYMRTGNSDAVSVKTEGGVSASVGGAGPAETNDEAPPSGYEAEGEFGSYGGYMGGDQNVNYNSNVNDNQNYNNNQNINQNQNLNNNYGNPMG